VKEFIPLHAEVLFYDEMILLD